MLFASGGSFGAGGQAWRPSEQLRVVELDSRTRGVQGCGKKATYVETCDGPKQAAMTECTWVMNTPSQ